MNPSRNKEDLGRLTMKAQSLCFHSCFYPSWELPVASMTLLGEYTNEDGPHAADHFLIFIDCEGNQFEVPFDAEGTACVLRQLSSILAFPLKTHLLFETSFASRVLWPPGISGQELFQIRIKNQNITDRILSLVGLAKVEFVTRPEVLEALGLRNKEFDR